MERAMAETVKQSTVQECDVPSLFQRLSAALLTHSTLQCSTIDYCFQQPVKQPFLHDRIRVHHLSKKLAFSCMDVVLLRKWEWMSKDSGGLWQWLALSLTLHHCGKPKSARKLAAAVSWLLRKDCPLAEAENVIQFLFLLSTPNTEDSSRAEMPQGEEAGHIYNYYPDSVFELPLDRKGSAMLSNVAMAMELFNSQPGSGFRGFMNQEPSGDAETKNKLFGALSHSTSTDLDDLLGVPLLPSDHTHLSLLPKLPRVPPVTSSPVPAPPPSPAPPTTIALLEAAASSTEQGLLRSWEGWDTSLSFLCDANPPAPGHASLILTSKYAQLAGVASSCSLLSPQDSLLSPAHNLTTAVDSLPNPALQPIINTDSVLFAVSHSLQVLLVSCRAALHSDVSPSTTLVQVEQISHHIQPVTRFVLELVQKQSLEKFAVMDSLFYQCSQVQGAPHYFLFLSLLALALLNYLRIVEEWVFHGALDTNQCIGIEMDATALDHRDDSYWTRGYSTPTLCAPNFFSHLSQPILTCGKALNLLHLCQPNHPLCTGQFPWPHLKVAYSREQLVELERQCDSYSSDVTWACQSKAEELRLQRVAREEQDQLVMIQARQEARREGDRVRKQERADYEAEVLRKHSLALEQKEEMARFQALRSQQQEEERRADRELLVALQAQEQALLAREAGLQEQARQELEREYEQLSEQAEQRRVRAEWRVARLKLATTRQRFLRQQDEMWREEMDKNRAERGAGGNTNLLDQQLQTPPLGILHQSHGKVFSTSHTPSSAVQDNIQNTVENPGHTSRGHTPSSTVQNLLQDTVEGPSHTSISHAPSSTVQEEIVEDSSHASSRGRAPLSTVQNLLQDVVKDSTHTSSRGHAPPSTVQDLLQDTVEDSSHASSRGHAPPSTVQDLLQDTVEDSSHTSSRGHAPPSTVQDLLQATVEDSSHTSSRGHAPPSTVQNLLQDSVENSSHASSRGHAPPSTVQELLCNEEAWHGSLQDHGDPHLVSSRGHAPPSTIQRLLYKECDPGVTQPLPPADISAPIIPLSQPQPFTFHQELACLESDKLHDVLGKILVDCQWEKQVDLDFLSLFPLPSLLARSIELPLLTQCSLVNQSLLDYLVTHCQLHQHFVSLKRFLLLEDGEFGHSLSTQLCQQLSFGRDWQPLCSPSFLNPLLLSALESSLHHNTINASKLSFSLKYKPHTVHTNAVKALDFLELKYKVEWPCNIIITSNCLRKYNKVLQFLLEMKRSAWVLKQTFHQLKNCSGVDELRVRQLQIYRHEFQHFINIMHGYISSQLFGLTWEEFQMELTQQSQSLDDIIMAHNQFIDTALFRCLLSKKARPVMNLIYELLSCILSFSSHVSQWCSSSGSHSYQTMARTYKTFRDTVRLLISVLSKLIARGYQPHLEELALRLNFNSFYNSDQH